MGNKNRRRDGERVKVGSWFSRHRRVGRLNETAHWDRGRFFISGGPPLQTVKFAATLGF